MTIEDFIASMQAAWNAWDADAWAGHFAEDVDFVNIYGGYHSSRAKIRDSHEYLFKGIFESSHNTLTVERIRPLGGGLHSVLVYTLLKHKTGQIDGRIGIVLEESGDTFKALWFQNTMVSRPAHHGDQKDADKVNANYQRA